MGYSCKIYFRKDYVKKDGTCGIYLQVIINRKKKPLPLDLAWPVKYCEDSQELCKPRFKGDTESDDMNILLRDRLAQANEIFKYYRMGGIPLTMEGFMARWDSPHKNQVDFLKYFEDYFIEKYRNRRIGWGSYKRYKSTLSWLKQFRKQIAFSDFDARWSTNFDNFLKRSIKSRGTDTQNTRWGYHKYVKVVLNYARDIDQMIFTNPYTFFCISQKRGQWQAATEEEVIKLFSYYRKTSIATHRIVLRRFLFGVTTGLRIADICKLTINYRRGDTIVLKPQKTEGKSGITVDIPLSDMALIFWNHAVEENGNRLLFNDFSHQYGNRVLKDIAKKLKIKTNLHNHVSRHTWTTVFLNNGGSLRAAQRILGHTSVRTTEKYDHMNTQEVKKEMGKIKFFRDFSSGE